MTATEAQRKYTPRQLAALKCRIDFTAFCRAVYGPYRHAPHLAAIDAALADVARYLETGGAEGTARLMIEAPPRHGKSFKAARMLPAWLLGRMPDLRVIVAAHTVSLAESHSRWVRNTLRGATYGSIFPKTRLADDSQARDNWDLSAPAEGGLLAVGVGSAVVGRGGALIVADDLIASREQYESKTQRDALWSWFTDELTTRAAPVCAFVMIGSRWGLDDVAGRLQLQSPDRWRVLRLPALAGEDDVLGRAPGDPLWPEMYGRDALDVLRQELGSYSFEALYQQQPVSSGGGIFQRARFNVIETAPPDIVTRCRYWDLAFSDRTSADYTVGTLVGETRDGRIVVLDVQRAQLAWKNVTDRIAATAHADGPKVRIGLEAAFYQATAAQELLRRADMRQFSVRGIRPVKDKLTRALALSARVDAGMVSVLRRVWTNDFVDELCAFPAGRNDDQLDSVVGAYTMLARRTAIEATVSRWA